MIVDNESAPRECEGLKVGSNDVLWVIYNLRKRLGWSHEGIESGEQPVAKETIDTTVKEYADDGKFRYCIERGYNEPKARYNPYDLVVTTVDVVKNCRTYWTVSATYITMVCIRFKTL